MAAILKSKMVVSGNNIVRLYIFMTICIWQFPCNLCYIYLSSFFLKVAKNACKYHKLQSPAKFFPQIRFMGIFNMLFVIPFCINWHQKSFDINFFRVQPFSYQPNSGTCRYHSAITPTFEYVHNFKFILENPWTRYCIILISTDDNTDN